MEHSIKMTEILDGTFNMTNSCAVLVLVPKARPANM